MNEQWISDVINKAMDIGRQQISQGNVATYIPELGKARKEALGLCAIRSGIPIFVLRSNQSPR